MQVITDEIERALSAELYYLALIGALTLPDICAALESADAQTTGQRYQAWCETWFTPAYSSMLTGRDLWALRCGVVHHGRFGPPQSQYARVVFTLPNAMQALVHNVSVDDVLSLDALTFCRDMIQAALSWYAANQNKAEVIANLPRLVQYRSEGLPGYIVGIPIIA